jgi:hypothetical protein
MTVATAGRTVAMTVATAGRAGPGTLPVPPAD